MSSKISSTVGYLIAVAGLLTLFYSHHFFSKNPVTIVIQVLAVLLMVWARITFKSRSFHLTAEPTEGGLVTTGPYKYLRHPIYAAAIYLGWSCLIAFPQWIVVLGAMLITVGLFIRILLEEREVVKVYPEYAEYSKQAKRIIPFVF